MSASDQKILENIDQNTIELRRLLAAIALRKVEGLSLYCPMPIQQSFHDSMTPERVARGPNRAGKTLCVAAEVARAVTGQDPLKRYPKSGVWYCVGKQGREVAQVLYPMLFKPVAFRIIRDLETKEWRAYDPDNPQDFGRKEQCKNAPPLIPKRFVKNVAWEDKKTGLPKIAYLTNGWEIHFYSSESKPTQGSSIDGAWFDEEILDRDWYAETAARLMDRGGRFLWSATPQAGTERLYNLCERAAEQVEKGIVPRTVEEFVFPPMGNKYIDSKALAHKFEDDEDNYRVRVLGEFAILSGRVFPEYSPRLHEVKPFEIPDNWTRYASIDPGRQVCAVTFLAIPPPEIGDLGFLYDELYIKNCTAVLFGAEMARKQKRQTFRAFIIDMHEAKKHDTGGGRKIIEQYSEQLKVNKVRSILTGHEFVAGNDNVGAGIETIRFWLRIRSEGPPKLRVFSTMQYFIKEMKYYRNQCIKGVFHDKPEAKNSHTIDTLRYHVQYGPTWEPPKAGTQPHSPAYAYYLKQKQEDEKANGSVVFGPTGGGYGQGTSVR